VKTLKLLIFFFWSSTSLALSQGDEAPAFSLPLLGDSVSVELNKLRGKVIYLDFWASWCGPCRISLPQIDELQRSLGSDKFEVLAINLDEKPDNAIRFLKRFPVSYTVLSDPTGKVAEAYQLPGMPSSFIIDQSGRISMSHTGFKKGDIKQIRNHIEKLLDNND